MKEASGELNMTLITVIAIGLILGVVTLFVPQIMETIQDTWGTTNETAQDAADGKLNN
jgi:H+/Cl- antiporter ClcA